jgi:hypothetical protein
MRVARRLTIFGQSALFAMLIAPYQVARLRRTLAAGRRK